MLKKNFIENKVRIYFYNILKNDLIFFDFLSTSNKQYILRYFVEDIENMNEYVSDLKKIFILYTKLLDKEKIYDLIDLISNKKIFFYSKQDNYKIRYFIEEKNIDKKILNNFFCDFIINIILDIYITCKNTIDFFNKYFDYTNKINILGLENNINFLKEKINSYYYFFINFYIHLLNKKDKDIKYIFPFYLVDQNKFLLSAVDMEDKKGGKAIQASDVDINKIKEIISDMENKNNNIKNYYTKDEIQKLENILENKKINKLILNNDIKLSKNYKKLVNSVVEDKNIENPDKLNKYNNSKIFFDQLFDVENKDNNKNTLDSLYEVYKTEPDKKKFIDYISDKIYYNNYLKTNNTLNDPNNLEKTTDMLVVFDKVFSQILNTNLENNMLKLSGDDVKFILILEVLNTLKQNVKNDSTSDKNITLNVFKEIKGVTVNDEAIKLN